MVFNVLNPRPDFNGDSKTDVFWRNHVTNQNAIWLMNGEQIQRGSFLPNVPEEAGWRETKLGDFNGDGKTDLFWRNAETGQNAIWLMDGDLIASAQYIAGADGNWQADIGDFNGDGKSDFFWHNKVTGQTGAWIMNSFTIEDAQFLPSVPPEWESFVAEFNRDGKTDLFWRNNSTGENAVWTMNVAQLGTGQFIRAQELGWSSTLVDLDADGRSDILWRNRDGRNGVWFWSTTSLNPESSQLDLLPSYFSKSDSYILIRENMGRNELFVITPSSGFPITEVNLANRRVVSLTVEGGPDLRGKIVQIGDFNGDGLDTWIEFFQTTRPDSAQLLSTKNPDFVYIGYKAGQLPRVNPLDGWRSTINFR